MRSKVWCAAACVMALGGCSNPDSKAILTHAGADLEKVQIEVVTGKAGANSNGTVVDATCQHGRHFKSAYANTKTLRIEPTTGGSGFFLDDGWVYVRGEFKDTSGTSTPDHPTDPETKKGHNVWPYWPIIIRSSMAIGADGTEFVADFTTPDVAWVRCRSGGPLRVYDHVSQKLIETIDPGKSARFKVTSSSTVLDVGATATDTKDPVYVEAVSTALSLKVTNSPP